MNHVEVLLKALESLSKNKKEQAAQCIFNNYRHSFIQKESRSMTHFEKLKIFINDGFIDRYTGKKLFFPNVLRILSLELGDVFPYQANWKMSDCHIAYWEFFPTYDHIVPIARGGKDEPANIVTTSQMMNSSKSGFLLEEIGIKIKPAGDMSDWDGMIHWYMNYMKEKNITLSDASFKSWNHALEKCIDEGIIT